MRTLGRQRLKNGFRRFMLRSEGSVATIFAVSLVPVLIAMGVGIDISRAMSSRTNLQDALDNTALALAHLPLTTPQATLEAKAKAWLDANLSDANMSAPVLTVKLTKGQVVLDATAKVSTTLTGIAGYKEVPIAASSTVQWGLGHVEVALVLDNTGSMAGTKLTRLKDAANDLVDTLAGNISADDPTALKIGVVPFSMTVRLSSSSSQLTTYRSASWMKGNMPSQYGEDLFYSNSGSSSSPTKSAVAGVNRFNLFDSMGVSWAGCVESRPDPYDVQDTAPSSGTPATQFVPFFAPDEPDDDTVKRSTYSYYYWQSQNNYLDDGVSNSLSKTDQDSWWVRQGNKNKYNQYPDTSYGKGPNSGCTMQPLLRLTTSTTTVKARLTAMNAVGNTNIPIGLMWGWHVLSPNLPFADGVAYSDQDTKKFIVLLTDGDNTNDDTDNPNASTYSALGYIGQKRLVGADDTTSASARTTAMDARMKKLCDNIKAAGITIYAVRIDVSGTAPQALSSCASSTDKFYDIDSSGLSEAFQTIAGSISELRIAK